MSTVDLFHIGPQKSATTWLYRCCQQHPGMVTAPTDALHYFDLHHHRGHEWLERQFAGAGDGVRIDFTPSYVRDRSTLERIAGYNPRARVILHIRDPIDRCVSHYWHERKKRRFNYRLEEVLDNYDLFANWIAPGLYGSAVKQCHELFGRERTQVIFYEDIAQRPEEVLRAFFAFAGVDAAFEPTIARVRVNQAQGFWSFHGKRAARRAIATLDRVSGGRASARAQQWYDRRRAGRAPSAAPVEVAPVEAASVEAASGVAHPAAGSGMVDETLRAELLARLRADMVLLHEQIGRVPQGWQEVIQSAPPASAP